MNLPEFEMDSAAQLTVTAWLHNPHQRGEQADISKTEQVSAGDNLSTE